MSTGRHIFLLGRILTYLHDILETISVLASAGVQRNKDGQNPRETHNTSSDSCSTSKIVSELATDQYKKTLDDGVETFLDEMGRLRVSRVRAMGIRMTRDLQRNLDLMKELEQGKTSSHSEASRLMINKNPSEASQSGSVKSVDLNEKDDSPVLVKESSIQISFEDDGEIKHPDGDEDLFARLVAGNSLTPSCPDKIPSIMDLDSASDVDWEEGKMDSFSQEGEVETKSVLDRGCIDDESEVEWEEEFCTNPAGNPFSTEASPNKPASKGSLEEDAELQEAIRRSLQDKKFAIATSKDEKQQIQGVHSHEHCMSSTLQKNVEKERTLSGDNTMLDCEFKDGAANCNPTDGTYILQRDEPYDILEGASVQLSKQDAGEKGNLLKNECLSESMLPLKPNLDVEKLLNVSSGNDGVSASAQGPISGGIDICIQNYTAMHDTEAVPSHLTTDRSMLKPQLLELSGNDVSCEQVADDNYMDDFSGKLQNVEEFVVETNRGVNVDITNLEDEMRKLSQECTDLGNEQKKLERNAESVNSEMFTECQVVLH